MENMRYFINLIEKIISSNGPNEAPDLMNPTLQEFEAACSRTEYGDMRGMLLGNGDLYLSDAEYSNHTDLITSLGLTEDDDSMRIIAIAPCDKWELGRLVVEIYAKEDDALPPDPNIGLKKAKNSPALRRIMRSGASILSVSWDANWTKNREVNGNF